MYIYKYDNYQKYIENQKKATIRKFKNVWVCEEEIKIISNYMKEYYKEVEFGICHGVRNGFEVKNFNKLLSNNIIGTEISELAADVKNIVIWDFNIKNEEWVNSCDFIYTNSLDHSPDPSKTLEIWFEQLKPGGFLFVEWTDGHSFSPNYDASIDCFLASKNEYKNLLEKNGTILDIIDITEILKRDACIFVLKKIIVR